MRGERKRLVIALLLSLRSEQRSLSLLDSYTRFFFVKRKDDSEVVKTERGFRSSPVLLVT